MIPAIALAKLVPVLAILGLALTGVENVPGAIAHSPSRRNHQHLAARAALEANVAAQSEVKKRYVIRKRADGSQCRVKGGSFSSSRAAAAAGAGATSTTSVAAAPPPVSDATSSAVVVHTQAPAPAASSAAAPTQNNQNLAAPSSSQAAPSPAHNNNNNNNGGGGGGGAWGGWTNVHSKMGLAWPNGNWAGSGSSDYIGNYIGSKSSWYYTWSPWTVGNGDALGLEAVPMLWGPHQTHDWWSQQGNWPSTVKNALFFNEPNEPSQCNMAAGDSVSYWMNDFLPMRRRGIRLGGAATTSHPNGLTWSQDFERLCVQYGNSRADCTPDFIPIHWYDVSIDGFKQYVQNYYNGVGRKPLWVTEYACQNFNGGAQCSSDQTWALHVQMAEWFDQQDYIERYSPFGAMKQMQGVNQYNALMNPDGSITDLGKWYIWSS